MDLGRRLGGLVAATHPVPALSVTVLAAALAAARGADSATLALVLACNGSGQASVGWSNDFLDRFDDLRAGRTDKPIVTGRVSPDLVGWSAAGALLASVLFGLPLGIPAALAMGAAVASAWFYNAALKRTLLSWLPYAVSFGLLVVFVWLATGGPPAAWLVAAGSLLGVAGHLTNVLPDLDADATTGSRGLPHRLGPGPSLIGACAALGGALGLALLAGGSGRPSQLVAAGVAGALVLAVAVVVIRGRPRTGFRLTIAAAGAIAAVVALSPDALAG